MSDNHHPGEGTIPPQGASHARGAMEALDEAGIPFLVAGAYALACYTGIERHTKDFDIFVEESDIADALDVLTDEGFRTEMESEIWIAKAFKGQEYVDLIFNSGNARTRIDRSWFDHAEHQEVFGMDALICPPEEMIWSKAYIMERERYDGADVAHLLRCCASELDWERLLARFEEHWRVLLSHLILYGFIYPAHRDKVPAEVMHDLLERTHREVEQGAVDTRLCRGTLLSRSQYGIDVEMWGCQDARVEPHGELTHAQARELSPPYRPRSERA
ncbi:MAG: nucleotidyltransferase [Persicimonas sp.]